MTGKEWAIITLLFFAVCIVFVLFATLMWTTLVTSPQPTSVAIQTQPTTTELLPTSTPIVPTLLIRATATQSPVAIPTLTSTPIPVSRRMELREANDKGKLKMTIIGGGLQYINLSLELTDDQPTEIVIVPGTIFQPSASWVQNMVVRTSTSVILPARGTSISARVPVACANMQLGQPDTSDRFTIKKDAAHPDLLRLLSLSEFATVEFRVQQFAIWTITDNPPRDEYHKLTTTFGASSGPTPNDFEKIRALFTKAGIQLTRYKAFQ